MLLNSMNSGESDTNSIRLIYSFYTSLVNYSDIY